MITRYGIFTFGFTCEILLQFQSIQIIISLKTYIIIHWVQNECMHKRVELIKFRSLMQFYLEFSFISDITKKDIR